ncbi:MAG: L,D-transpeptidase [Anaerolineales bacterium]|nr:L,D-transpeptidase [Anaerolineales bacterium]
MSSLSRREFLRLCGLAALAVAAPPLLRRELGSELRQLNGGLGRVAYESVSVFDAPLLNARTLGYRFRDELLQLEYSLAPLAGPAYNPLWYRIDGGYVHAALIQPVEEVLNPVLEGLPASGQLCRVTMPFTQPYNYSRAGGWQREGRFMLYYDSNHWVTDIVEGPDGDPWYQITESWSSVQYYAAGAHLQSIPDEDFAPIATDVPAGEKRIEILLAQQSLTAYEGNQVAMRTFISSGVRNTGAAGLPTQTPTGTFNITSKMPSIYMGDNRLTDTLGDRFLPGVPWTLFFAEGGYAIHGAYWHNNYGAPMSRGCVNMRPEEARWLYRWATPRANPGDWEARGFGTRVIVR